jgi:phosphatidate cytidylyltransferase
VTGALGKYLLGNYKKPMRRRLLTVLVMTLIGVPAILIGGIFYFLLMSVFLIGAAREYVILFRAVKFEPSMLITLSGVGFILLTRMFFVEYAVPVFTIFILIAMAYHLIIYEKGRDQSAIDFAITVTGIVYVGWLGAYLLDLRNLPQGGWWFMLVMFCIWGGDSGAYSIGRAYGKHKIAPRLSPKKSWEGYIASVISGAGIGAFYLYVFTTFGYLETNMTYLQAASMGLLLGALPTLGDLGESMIKRQSGIKDSSDIMPGHGGFFDRIDFLVWFIL